MKIKPSAIGAGLILVSGMTVGCAAKYPVHGGPAGRDYSIYVRKVEGKCYITEKTLTIWLSDHPTVEWVSDDNETYTAHFEAKNGLPNPAPGTPFGDSEHPKKDVKTGEGPQAPKRKGEYLYSVLDGSSRECIPASDPGVYVK